MTRRCYVYKLKPTAEQGAGFQRYLDVTREVYNAALEQRIRAYRLTGSSPRWFAQKREIKQLRGAGLLEGCHVHPVQDTLRRLDLAYQAFFDRCARGARRKGFPRFRSRRRGGRSPSTSGATGCGSTESAPGFGSLVWERCDSASAGRSRAFRRPARSSASRTGGTRTSSACMPTCRRARTLIPPSVARSTLGFRHSRRFTPASGAAIRAICAGLLASSPRSSAPCRASSADRAGEPSSAHGSPERT